MRRPLAAALLSALSASAQAQTSTRADILSLVNSSIIDNVQQLVTPKAARNSLLAIINNMGVLGGANTWTGTQTFGPVAFSDPVAARTALGAAASGANGDITALNGVQFMGSGNLLIAGANGVGVVDSGFKLLATYVGAVPPGVNDDSTRGYAAGSSGVNTASGVIYVCQSASPGAAVWVVTSIPGLATYVSTVAPGPSNDATQGYGVGSMGINTATGRTYMAKSVGTGVAVWVANGKQIVSPIAGNWHIASGHGGTLAASSAVGSTTTVVLTLFHVGQPMTINGLGSRVAVVGSSTFVEAIYASDQATNLPTGTPIIVGTNLSDTSTGPVTGAISPAVSIPTPGDYWSAQEVNDTTAAFTGPTTGLVGERVGSANSGFLSSTTRTTDCISAPSSAYGSWPDLTSASFTFLFGGSKCGVLFYKAVSVP